jgi:hypothetical protein
MAVQFYCDNSQCQKKIEGEYFKLRISGLSVDKWFVVCKECKEKLEKDYPQKQS